jgi:SAM-dependent methyltransferase
VTGRQEILMSFFNPRGVGLEIGPAYNPLLPKSSGYNVETVDYTDRKGLLDKYKDNPHVDPTRIEEVDFVSGGRSLLETIPHRERYDHIVASHVIEHSPDLLGFLLDCEQLLKPEGVLILAVPDKRFCFDLLQPLSTTGAILQAHLERRCRPQPGAIFDSVVYDVLRDGQISWPPECSTAPTFNASLAAGRALFKHAASCEQYIDVHVWRFVPSSFRLIIEDLHGIEACALLEQRFELGPSFEFFISLSRAGTGPNIDRAELAAAVLQELRSVPLPDSHAAVGSRAAHQR